MKNLNSLTFEVIEIDIVIKRIDAVSDFWGCLSSL